MPPDPLDHCTSSTCGLVAAIPGAHTSWCTLIIIDNFAVLEHQNTFHTGVLLGHLGLFFGSLWLVLGRFRSIWLIPPPAKVWPAFHTSRTGTQGTPSKS